MSRFNTPGRFDYAGPYKTREKAEAVLEEMFATGDICAAEQPQVEVRSGKTASWSRKPTRYFVTVPA